MITKYSTDPWWNSALLHQNMDDLSLGGSNNGSHTSQQDKRLSIITPNLARTQHTSFGWTSMRMKEKRVTMPILNASKFMYWPSHKHNGHRN